MDTGVLLCFFEMLLGCGFFILMYLPFLFTLGYDLTLGLFLGATFSLSREARG